MSEYGSGISMETAARLDRDRIEHALDGELMVGEDSDGFVYGEADGSACRDFVLAAFDSWVHEAMELAASGRALERVMDAHGIEIPFAEYLEAREAERD